VVCQKLWLQVRHLRESLLEDARDSAMQLLAAGLEQRLIRDVLDQGVLEAVGDLGQRAVAEDQLGSNQFVESALQPVFRLAGHGDEQLIRELAPDHGADLGKLPDRPNAIEPSHERVV